MLRWTILCLLAAAGAARAQSIDRCVEARIGADVSYGCLNEAFSRLVDRAHGSPGFDTLGATSPAPAVGTFNRTATAERMGDTFGHSVYPQRPDAPAYGDPLLGGAGGAQRLAVPAAGPAVPYHPPSPLFGTTWLAGRAKAH